MLINLRTLVKNNHRFQWKTVVFMVAGEGQLAQIVAPIAEKYQIPFVYLFGSCAIGTATEESDIDLLIDTNGTELKSLFQLAAVLLDLATAAGKWVDLITESSFEPHSDRISMLHFRDAVKRERKILYCKRETF